MPPAALQNPQTVGIGDLRRLLAEKYPSLESKPSGVLRTGLCAFDDGEGGLRRGALTEVTGSLGGGGLFLQILLAAIQRARIFAALVDSGASFDPQGTNARSLCRLLWVVCRDARAAVKAADLILRDGNLPLLIVDFQRTPARELQRVPASTWHRFQRIVEQSATAFVVLTPRPMIEAAQVRVGVNNRWDLQAMRKRRRTLLGQIDAQVFIRRTQAAPHLRDLRSA